jgi:hypothetical protein
MSNTFFNPDNKTSKELTRAKYKQKKYFENSQKRLARGLYEF